MSTTHELALRYERIRKLLDTTTVFDLYNLTLEQKQILMKKIIAKKYYDIVDNINRTNNSNYPTGYP